MTRGVAPNREFVIEYRDVPYTYHKKVLNTFQIILHESGDIIMKYLDATSFGTKETIAGIEDLGGFRGVQCTKLSVSGNYKNICYRYSKDKSHKNTKIYYGEWSNSTFDETHVYCGWWSAVNIVSTSSELQIVPVTIYAQGCKHEGEITLDNYGIYAVHVYTMMKDFGYNPLLCKGAFTVKVENTEHTYSVFFIHNGSHSYIQ